jgi:hypothetical protein
MTNASGRWAAIAAHNPEQAVGDDHGPVGIGRGPVQQERAGRRRCPAEQTRALLDRRVAQRTLQQSAHDAEREVALGRPRRGAADQAARVGGEPHRVVQQRGLAQTGRSVEHDDSAGSPDEPADRLAEQIELEGALDQRQIGGGAGGMLRSEHPEVPD